MQTMLATTVILMLWSGPALAQNSLWGGFLQGFVHGRNPGYTQQQQDEAALEQERFLLQQQRNRDTLHQLRMEHQVQQWTDQLNRTRAR